MDTLSDSELVLKFCKKSKKEEFDVVGYTMMLNVKNKKLEIENSELTQRNNTARLRQQQEIATLQRKITESKSSIESFQMYSVGISLMFLLMVVMLYFIS